MSITGNYREVAIAKAPTQAELVNKYLEMAPVIANMPVAPTSDGTRHVFEKVNSITNPQQIDLDAPVPLIDVNSELDDTTVIQFGGKLEVGIDKLKTLNKSRADYFNSKLRIILPNAAQAMEKSILNNSLLQYAIDNGKNQDATGTNTGNMYSMLCTTWTAGSIEGLYNDQGWGGAAGVFETIDAWGGGAGYIQNASSQNIMGYSSEIKTQIGMQLADDRYVAAIGNIDVAKADTATGRVAIPTEEQIDDMILAARGFGPNAVVYLPYEVLVALNTFKGSALQMNVADANFDRRIATWNGTPMIPTYNFGTTS